MIKRLLGVFRIARHFRLSQIVLWIVVNLRRRIDRVAFCPHQGVSSRTPLAIRHDVLDRLAEMVEPADPKREGCAQLEHDRRCYAGLQRRVDREMKDMPTDVPLLWHFRFHYHEEIVDAVAAGRGDLAEDFLERWWRRQSSYEEIAWHPFVVASRLFNWVSALSIAGIDIRERLWRVLEPTWQVHLNFLERRCEVHLCGNHLLRERAAVVVGACVASGPESPRIVCENVKRLVTESRRQITVDGTHYERSPMYHGAVFHDLLRARCAIDGWRELGSARSGLEALLAHMRVPLTVLVRPDGDYPHFNDSSNGMYPPARWLLARHKQARTPAVAWEGVHCFREGGFFAWGHFNGSYVVFDLGKGAARESPGHFHDDGLSFELYVRGIPLLINLGVHGYESDPYRSFVRQARSHNTLEFSPSVSELWGAFRVGAMAKFVRSNFSEEAGGWTIMSEIASAQERGLQHCRSLGYRSRGSFVVHDRVNTSGTVRGYLHFAPGVSVVIGDDGARLGVHVGELSCEVTLVGWIVDRLFFRERQSGFGCYFRHHGSIEGCFSVVLLHDNQNGRVVDNTVTIEWW